MGKLRSTIKRTDDMGLSRRGGAAAQQPGLLVVHSGGKPMWSILPVPLPEGQIELGRENLGELTEDGRISRQHVRVCFKDGCLQAMDLGSLNGTQIDGLESRSGVLQPVEHCLRVGDTLLLPVQDVVPLQGSGITVRDGLVIGPRLAKLYQRIARVASSSSSLHITGDSGAGKENAARTFHASSAVSSGPFIAVNCATIPESIAERLLFGAKRGAFSGVVADTDGYIQAANGGTLFLDEIAELHSAVQAKLLRVLENREVLALGALRPQSVNLRVCSASHRSLYTEVASGRLREDLYYRIGRPTERVPSLRERPEEIPWLIDLELRKSHPGLGVHASAVEACLLRPWPGNIRELLVEIRSAAQEALADDCQRVKAEHLSPEAGVMIKGQPAAPAQPLGTGSEPPPPEPAEDEETGNRDAPRPSRAQIIAALIEAQGNVSAAARELGVQRTNLRRQISHYGIDINRLREH